MKITIETGNIEIDEAINCVSKYSDNSEFIDAMEVLVFYKKNSSNSCLSEISDKLQSIDNSIGNIP